MPFNPNTDWSVHVIKSERGVFSFGIACPHLVPSPVHFNLREAVDAQPVFAASKLAMLDTGQMPIICLDAQGALLQSSGRFGAISKARVRDVASVASRLGGV
jgi:hypothetical protein